MDRTKHWRISVCDINKLNRLNITKSLIYCIFKTNFHKNYNLSLEMAGAPGGYISSMRRNNNTGADSLAVNLLLNAGQQVKLLLGQEGECICDKNKIGEQLQDDQKELVWFKVINSKYIEIGEINSKSLVPALFQHLIVVGDVFHFVMKLPGGLAF